MAATDRNALVYRGDPGHYEVYYISLTDPGSGTGLWIRYTMLAPLPGRGEATCALWLMAMEPGGRTTGRKATFPISDLRSASDPFELTIARSTLTDAGMQGGFEDCAWDLHWTPTEKPYEHVHPFLRRTKIAKTVLVLPHADLAVSGSVTFAERRLTLDGARGGQAHLWGSKHATSWAWVHCNDLESIDGEPRPGTFLDGVSVIVPRLGRQVGPSTPVVGRFGGRDLIATSPLAVARAPSSFSLTNWRFEARDGDRRIVGEVDAPRESLVGVTYTDPDGEHAYCYNSEIASMRVWVWERGELIDTLRAPGRAHFEYAQRQPIAGLELHVT